MHNETWKALDLYKIAVSDKGRIRVEGEIMEPLPPNSQHKRMYFKFRNPLTGRDITRDAANLVWRTFRFAVHTDIIISPIDGDLTNIQLDNLKWEYRVKPKPKHSMTPEQMKARVPEIIEKMVKKWGFKDIQEPVNKS